MIQNINTNVKFALFRFFNTAIRSNFKKYEADKIDYLGESYDYDSIMHYDQYAYAIDEKMPTIVPKDASANIDDNFDLSQKDIIKLNKLYKC